MQLTQGLKEEVHIRALVTKVWNVLTSPHYTKQYLFEGELICDWKCGSAIIYKLETDKSEDVFYRGKVIHIEPFVSLEFTIPAPENPGIGTSTLSYELIPNSAGTQLTLTSHGEFPSQEFYNMMMQNWRMVLQKIKWLAEYA